MVSFETSLCRQGNKGICFQQGPAPLYSFGREGKSLFYLGGGKENMTATATMSNTAVSVSVSKAAKTFNYAPFRSTIRQYINEKITRERFICDWGIEQREQGIRATRLVKI
jgi:hypothetical protein